MRLGHSRNYIPIHIMATLWPYGFRPNFSIHRPTSPPKVSLMDDTGCSVAGVVAVILIAVSVRISSSVEMVEAGMFSFNGLWVGLKVTSESLASLLALLAIIW